MSWDSATSAGSNGATGASSAAGAAGSMAGNGSSLYGQMADVGGSAPAQSGFSMDAVSSPNTGTGPTVDNGNMQTYGTKDPSYLDKGMKGIEQFQKGGQHSLREAYNGFGNNPETYGYIASKIPQGGGGGAAPAMTTNISYQQPQNDYLKKHRGY